jgi:hypothetical protein
LAAVNKGIHDIDLVPFHELVEGDAKRNLEAQASALRQAIIVASRNDPTEAAIDAFHRDAVNRLDKQHGTLKGVRDGIAGVVAGVAVLTNLTRAEYLFRKQLYAQEKAILKFTNDPSGRTHLLPGGQFAIPSLTRLKGSDLLTVAEALTQKFTHSQAPFYRSAVNQERTLRALRDAQRLAIARGDTRTAAKLGSDIKTLQTHVDRVKHAVDVKKLSVSVNTSNKVYYNGRIVYAATSRYLSAIDAGNHLQGLI